MRPHRTSAIVRACLAVSILFAAACGSGGDAAGGRGGARSPAPSPQESPAGITVGDEATPGPGSTAVPDPGATPGASSVPATADPAQAVRTFLEAVEAEDYATQYAVSSGPARVLIRIRDIIRQENERRGATTDNQVTVSSEPRTADRTPDRATVSVEANIHSVVSGEEGTQPSDASVAGPVTLVRTDDRWTIEDYSYAGGQLGPNHIAVGQSQTRNKVRLEVASVLSYKSTTAVLIRLVNTEEGGVPLSIKATLTDAAGETHDATQIVPEPRDTPAVFCGFARVERATGLRIRVEHTQTGDAWDYTVSF